MLSEKVIENTGGIIYNLVLLEYLIINVANKKVLIKQFKQFSNVNFILQLLLS